MRDDNRKQPGIIEPEPNKDDHQQQVEENYWDEESLEPMYYDPMSEDYQRAKKKHRTRRAPSRKELRESYRTARSFGKPAAFFLLMMLGFFIINLLTAYGVIPRRVRFIFFAMVLLLVGIDYIRRHRDDEDTLD